MGWVDRVPRAGNLFIGGLYALYQPNIVKDAGVTHVLSVIDFDFYELTESNNFLKSKGYNHKIIQVDDDPNVDLLCYFQEMVDFIDGGLRNGGGVFVHCAMGKSRSATAVIAYLMWKYGVGMDEGLQQLCEGRPVCFPNPGFLEQLAVWQTMLQEDSQPSRARIYEQWLQGRFKGEAHEWEARAAKAKL